jgi:hypothetical protein
MGKWNYELISNSFLLWMRYALEVIVELLYKRAQNFWNQNFGKKYF